jgi:hypothetical protein
MACEEVLIKIPEEVYDNPLDIEHITEEGIETPALLFFPDEININTNEIFTVSVYALDVQNVAGAYININYDQDKLMLIAINSGTFFSDLKDPLYFSETQNSGKIELYTVFFGADSSSVSGTGSFFSIMFAASANGASSLTFGTDSELVDPDDIQIEIKGFGEGLVNAH